MAPRLDCLGSGHAFSHGRYWSGFLLDGRILLDCPPQTLAHLYQLNAEPAALDLVLLSHAHSDHIGGVDLLLLDVVMAHGGRLAERPLTVAGPHGIYARLREVIGDSPRLPARDADGTSRPAWGSGAACGPISQCHFPQRGKRHGSTALVEVELAREQGRVAGARPARFPGFLECKTNRVRACRRCSERRPARESETRTAPAVGHEARAPIAVQDRSCEARETRG